MFVNRIDRIVEWTKWPVANAAILLLPSIVFGLWQLIEQSTEFPIYLIFFLLGMLGVGFVAQSSIAKSRWGPRLIEAERDVTQAILAFAMLHPVIGYGGNQRKGARIRWLGKGNWILLATPYFFPMAALLLWTVSLVVPIPLLRCSVLGFGVGYHLLAVLYQVRMGTSELRRLGTRFVWFFLPAANLFFMGCAFAYAIDGFRGIFNFLSGCLELPRMLGEHLGHWIAGAKEPPT